MGLMENITNATMGEDGCSPTWVIWLVRIVVLLIWWTHDFFFAAVFGRGDGLGDNNEVIGTPSKSQIDIENQLLLRERRMNYERYIVW
jgi:hypothetical protein